jgi:hypothetical protein
LILRHPRASREEKPKRTHRQVLVCLHRFLPRELFAKISLKVVQAVWLVKEKMWKFRHIFAAFPATVCTTSSGGVLFSIDLTQALGSARVWGTLAKALQL